MKIWIVYYEDQYDSYRVRKIFSSYDSATRFVANLDSYERGLSSIEEDWVED